MKITFKPDWVMVVRVIAGLILIGVGIYYKDWIPGIFGALWVFAGFLRRGCGYGNCNIDNEQKPGNHQSDETTFTEIK